MGQTSNLSRGSGIFRYCILLTLGIFILTASACSCCNIVWSFVTVMLNYIEKGEDGADCIKIAHFCGSSEMLSLCVATRQRHLNFFFFAFTEVSETGKNKNSRTFLFMITLFLKATKE